VGQELKQLPAFCYNAFAINIQPSLQVADQGSLRNLPDIEEAPPTFAPSPAPSSHYSNAWKYFTWYNKRCPDEYTILSSATQCKEYAEDKKFPYGGEVHSSNYPPGCFWHENDPINGGWMAYYRQPQKFEGPNFWYSHLICVKEQTPWLLTSYGCANNNYYKPIASYSECAYRGKLSLGQMIPRQEVNETRYPKGCSVQYNPDGTLSTVTFNTSPTVSFIQWGSYELCHNNELLCNTCYSGDPSDGGIDVVDGSPYLPRRFVRESGKCTQFCTIENNECGTTTKYSNGGTDCRGMF